MVVQAYMQFLGLAECAETMQKLPIFYNQKAKLFYPGWTYAIPAALVRIPIMFIEVTGELGWYQVLRLHLAQCNSVDLACICVLSSLRRKC